MKFKTIAMILLIALVLMLVVYFALALVSWRCPSCHQYLPLKNATKLKECPHCHSKNVDYMTRIIGYLKRVSNFSQARQEEASRRYYAGQNKLC